MDRKYVLEYIVAAGNSVATLKEIDMHLYGVARAGWVAQKDLAALNTELQILQTQSTGAIPQLNQLTGGLGKTTEAGHSLTKSLLGTAAGFVVIQGGMAVLEEMGSRANAARSATKELAEEVGKLRDTYRELATLQAKGGPDDQVIAESLKMGIQAGMTPEETRDFNVQFLGSIEAGRNKGNIAPETEESVATEGAKFGVRTKLQAKTAGDLTGVISQYTKIGSDTDAAKVLGQIEYGLQKGRGEMEPLVRSFIKTAGAVMAEEDGSFDDLGELGVVLGVASTHAGTGREAGTLVKSSAMSLRNFTGSQGFALRQAGITGQDSYMDALRKLAVPVAQANAQGIATDQFLMNSGWNNKDEIFGLKQAIDDLPITEVRLRELKGITGEDTKRKDERFFTTEKVGVSRRNTSIRRAHDLDRGMRGEELESAKKVAETEIYGEGQQDSTKDFVFGDMLGLKPFLGFQKTRDQNIEIHAMQTARKTRLEQIRQRRWRQTGSTAGYEQEFRDEWPSLQSIAAHESANTEGIETETGGDLAFRRMREGDRRKTFNALSKKIREEGDGATTNQAGADAVVKKLDDLIGATKETNTILREKENVGRVRAMELPAAAFGIGAGVASAVPGRLQ